MAMRAADTTVPEPGPSGAPRLQRRRRSWGWTGRKLAVPCAISTVTVLEGASQRLLALLGCGVQPEMNIQKVVRGGPMLGLGLRTGVFPKSPFPPQR